MATTPWNAGQNEVPFDRLTYRLTPGEQRIEPSTVLTLAEEASRRGQVVGVRMSDALDEDERAPWRRPPSGRVRKISTTEPVPATVKAVLSQRLFVEKAGLPSPLINQLERLAAFQNPDFYKKQSMRLVAGYGQVILDEAHHCPAVSFERVLAEVKAKYLVGLTATPTRRDGHQPILHMQLGPVRHAVDPKNQAARRPFEHKLVLRETSFSSTHLADKGIQEIYAALAADESRNDLIFDDVVHALEEGRSPILLTERRDHLESLAERLEGSRGIWSCCRAA